MTHDPGNTPPGSDTGAPTTRNDTEALPQVLREIAALGGSHVSCVSGKGYRAMWVFDLRTGGVVWTGNPGESGQGEALARAALEALCEARGWGWESRRALKFADLPGNVYVLVELPGGAGVFTAWADAPALALALAVREALKAAGQ